MYHWYWFSLYILFGLVFLSLLGLIWAPFGAFIAYLIVRGKEKHPVRYTFAAAVCSVLFILPWVSLIVSSRFRYLATNVVIVCAYIVWLMGPLALLFLFHLEPLSPGEDTTGIVVAMSLAWTAALIWTIRSQVRHSHQCRPMPAHRVIMPSTGLWVSTAVCLVTVFDVL